MVQVSCTRNSYDKTRTRILVQEVCVQVAQRTIQVRTRNMADDRDDEEYILIKLKFQFFQETTL